MRAWAQQWKRGRETKYTLHRNLASIARHYQTQSANNPNDLWHQFGNPYLVVVTDDFYQAYLQQSVTDTVLCWVDLHDLVEIIGQRTEPPISDGFKHVRTVQLASWRSRGKG